MTVWLDDWKYSTEVVFLLGLASGALGHESANWTANVTAWLSGSVVHS